MKNDLEQVAQDYAKRVVECNPNAKDAEGLIATAVVYGANESYYQLAEMDFGNAIKVLKRGLRVRRKGWNDNVSFLWLKPASTVKAEWCKDLMLRGIAMQNGGEIPALGTICMYTAQGEILSGWVASQTDVLAEDWELV